jgi:hypothetical protein
MAFFNSFHTKFTKFYSFFICFGIFTYTNIFAQDFAKVDIADKNPNKTGLKAKPLSTNTHIEIKNDEAPLIARKGETLNVKLDNPKNEKLMVRLHSSLGRLVKEYTQVKGGILIETTTLLAGVYFVIVKRQNVREIKKLLITD